MDLIGFLGDADGLAPQLLPFESIGFVDVEGAFEPGDGGLTNIADCKISMERLFVNERLLSVVLNLQLQLQIGADRYTKPQGKIGISESTGGFIRREDHGDLHVSVVAQLGSFERPLRDTRKAMSRTGSALRARAEPRKDNRYSAADRPSRRKRAFGAEE